MFCRTSSSVALSASATPIVPVQTACGLGWIASASFSSSKIHILWDAGITTHFKTAFLQPLSFSLQYALYEEMFARFGCAGGERNGGMRAQRPSTQKDPPLTLGQCIPWDAAAQRCARRFPRDLQNLKDRPPTFCKHACRCPWGCR